MIELAIAYTPVTELRPFARNARTHSKKQIRQIADSITTFGFTSPVLIDDANTILAGHGRVEAAKLVGMDCVPCVRLASMTPEQKRAYVLADNKLALNAGWDEDLLAQELQFLSTLDLDFDVGITGFTIAETDLLIENLRPEEAVDPRDEKLPALRPEAARVQLGDLWALGPHRLLCGSALEADSYTRLMAGERAQMVFTDPPYNVPIQGHVGGSGAIQHREFAMAAGEMTEEAFTAFLRTAFTHLVAYSQDGAIHFVCMDWRHMDEMRQAGHDTYAELKNLIVWIKTNAGMGTFYRSRHELVFVFKHGTGPHVNSFELGQHGRNRTNVWEYAGANSFRAGRMEELALHPTVKPVAMVADAIKDVSGRGGLVLDPFGGSGSTLIAAHKTGRRARLIELDPVYCDRILRRWELYAKDDAVLVERCAAATDDSIGETGSPDQSGGPLS